MSLSTVFKWFHAPHKVLSDSLYGEKEFAHILARERARADRSTHRFSLVTFATRHEKLGGKAETHLLIELNNRMRATDEAGWLLPNKIGVILHNSNAHSAWNFAKYIQMSLLANGIQLLCEVYSYPPPQDKGAGSAEKIPKRIQPERGFGHHFTRDLPEQELSLLYLKRISRKKRCLDLLGSSLGLILLSPLFVLLWCVIKSVSPGPAIYRQTRIGLGGRPFQFLKFRTMEYNADTTGHQKHLASLIPKEDGERAPARPMVKLDDHNDQIIPFGKLLRKTYLDELPQLVNVLKGDMSLIGPRPSIPYEVAEYQLWHKGRFDTTPGMTGLWQVSGKNRLTFNQMVRLDIQYARRQSLWLDIKILLMTPMTIASELKESLHKRGQLIRIGTGQPTKF
ncbi:MAG: sugar transferase [Proteobacteria bacterium]|nr:sugar transferase [Pseudomonadota bacterium]MBU1739434.1 sugar transferase [Pseudomonadota bacterium]